MLYLLQKTNCNTTFAIAETDQTYQDNVEKITKKVIDHSVAYFLIILQSHPHLSSKLF